MGIEVHIGRRDDAFTVRRRVFMDEQGYENEFDDIDGDARCIHVTACVDGELAGCARIFPAELACALAPGSPAAPACELDEGAAPGEIYLLGRVAVVPELRRRGIASQIAQAAAAAAREAGAKVCKLHAQSYVTGMYEKLGYASIADVDYEDEGQPHRWMARRL